MPNHKLDTDQQVFFYEQEFYVLSNFSSFQIEWKGILFPTSEHVYHWEKFILFPQFQKQILEARSAHDAFRIAQELKEHRRFDWDNVKVNIMFDILCAKVQQHPYVMKKLLETGSRELIEDSWRDDYWGWGENKDGKNVLGWLWMKVREEMKPINRPEVIKELFKENPDILNGKI